MSSKIYAKGVASESAYHLLELSPSQSDNPPTHRPAENNQTPQPSDKTNVSHSKIGVDEIVSSCNADHIRLGTPDFQFTRRLGRYLLITNAVALALLIVSLSALSFLWFGNESNIHWRYIMINGWVSQAVTLATLTIRLAVGIQASTAVAMLASVCLEASGGVVLGEAPALSISRYVNNGPLSTLPVFWRNATGPNGNYPFATIVLLAICTLLTQFSSTLLLWDVRSGTVQDSPQSHDIHIGMGMQSFIERFESTVSRGKNVWLSFPRSFQAFAEWNEAPEAQVDAVVDTGPTVRAFLPVGSDLERSMINRFEGSASLFDARVACIRPIITDWTFREGNVLNDASTRGYFKGFARPSQLTEELRQILRYNETEPGVYFQCVIDDLDVLSDPMFKTCSLSYTNGGLINSLDHTSNSSMKQHVNEKGSLNSSTSEARRGWVGPDDNSTEQWPVEMGHTFLMLRSQGDTDNLDNRGWQLIVNNFTQEERGPWLYIRPNGAHGLPYANSELGVTLCYDSWYDNGSGTARLKHLQEFPISAHRPSNHSEPSIGWSSAKKTFDTTAVRVQLGSDAQTAAKRGVFNLDIDVVREFLRTAIQQWSPTYNVSFQDVHLGRTQWFLNTTDGARNLESTSAPPKASSLFRTNGYSTNETYDFLNSLIWWPFKINPADVDHFEIYAPCENCTSYNLMTSTTGYRNSVAMQVLNPVLNAIFRDVLVETDNPALAWQALMTTVLRMAYYDWLPTFDSISEVTTVSNVACLKPKHFLGFLIVVGNILVHVCLVLIVTVYFGNTTSSSLLNNAWQVIAQLRGPETEGLLKTATVTNDQEIKQWISEGKDQKRRFWVKSDEHGQTHLCQ